MNEIVYLNHCKAELTDIGKVLTESRTLTPEFYMIDEIPTKCKVTINKTIVIDDVYVYHYGEGPIFLYKNFHAQKMGFTSDEILKNKGPWGWAVIIPENLVLEFRSDNYSIEKSNQI